MRLAVYTCITGNIEQSINNQNFKTGEFFLFTDNPTDSNSWKQIKTIDMFNDPRRTARYYKLLPHEFFSQYDYWLWLDGSIQLKVDAQELINYLEFKKADILTFKHPDRHNALEEIEECLRLSLDHSKNLNKYKEKLKKWYPCDNCLAETKIVLRKNTKKVIEFNMIWFYELMTGTLRDQVSFNYSAWKTKVKVAYLNPIIGENDWFKYYKHPRKTYGI